MTTKNTSHSNEEIGNKLRNQKRTFKKERLVQQMKKKKERKQMTTISVNLNEKKKDKRTPQ